MVVPGFADGALVVVHQIFCRVVPELPLLVVVHQILGRVVTATASKASDGVVVWSDVAHLKIVCFK